jgi:oxygen-dependent protoporphyrinogen oxidase
LPQYTLGHLQRLAEIDAVEQRHPGLFFAGNAYRGLGIPDCVRNAELLGERVAAFQKSGSSSDKFVAHNDRKHGEQPALGPT